MPHSHIPLSDFYILERKGPSRPKIADLPGTIQVTLNGLAVDPVRLKGKSIAVTVGSRGIADLQEIVRALCGWLKDQGAQPFIIPAMGSHGGATAEGQTALLAEYGVAEKEIGVPIRASMETLSVGKTPQGFDVFVDRHAWGADGIVVLGRVKPHTDFSGKVESGLLKMITIGLGKRDGAEQGHKQFWKYGFEPTVRAVSGKILEHGRIIFGIGVVENEMHEVAMVRAALPSQIVAQDESLLVEARAMMPRVPFNNLHLLIIDHIGKNISGSGMDLKVVGRIPGSPDEVTPNYSLIYLRDLTEESFGNSCGMGFADAIHERLFRKIDFEKTYINTITSLLIRGGNMPIRFSSDLQALDVTLAHLGSPEPEIQRVAWIRNTLNLDRIAVSSALKDQLESPTNWRLASGPFSAEFDAAGDLRSPF